MKSFLKKYQVSIFFALTFIISWYPWYTGGHGFRTWGPSLAGLIVVAVVGGRTGIVEMLRRLVRWRVGIVWWAVALLGPPAIVLVAVGIHVLAGGEAPSFLMWKLEPHLVPVLMLVLLLPMAGPGGEEPFGWRGYAQAKLLEKWGQWAPLIASLIIGTAWGIWHLPEFFDPTSSQYAIGMAGFVPLIIMEIANSIFMTWLYIKTGGSVLVAGVLWHLMIDTSAATLFLDFTLTGMLVGEAIPAAATGLINTDTVVMAAVALILVVVTRGRLGCSAKDEEVCSPGQV
jgi:hypothetical protein